MFAIFTYIQSKKASDASRHQPMQISTAAQHHSSYKWAKVCWAIAAAKWGKVFGKPEMRQMPERVISIFWEDWSIRGTCLIFSPSGKQAMNEVPCTGYIQQLKSYLCTFCAIIYGSEEGQIFHNYRKTNFILTEEQRHTTFFPSKIYWDAFPEQAREKHSLWHEDSHSRKYQLCTRLKPMRSWKELSPLPVPSWLLLSCPFQPKTTRTNAGKFQVQEHSYTHTEQNFILKPRTLWVKANPYQFQATIKLWCFC